MSPTSNHVALVALLLLSALRLDARVVAGTILDKARQPLSNIAVRVWGPRNSEPGSRSELAMVTTDATGRFRLDTGDRPTELLTLDGTNGTGRVRLDPASEAELIVPYPVRTTILLLHDNDLHFNFNHADRFTAEVTRLRKENRNVFLLNAGDAFIRSPGKWNTPTKEYYAELTRAIIDRMNALGYDAMTLGNHELDYIDDLTKAALGRATFPLLAANIDVTTHHLPQPQPFTVLTTDNDLTLAVLGLSTVNFAKSGVAIRDAYQAINQHLGLADRHTVLVALTHVGLSLDQLLARTTSGIDVIIGGHCHTLLTEAVTANGTLIAQAGGTAADRPNPVDPSRPKYLGIVTLTLENDRIVAKRGRVLTFTADVP
jgi:hypothetical protein